MTKKRTVEIPEKKVKKSEATKKMPKKLVETKTVDSEDTKFIPAVKARIETLQVKHDLLVKKYGAAKAGSSVAHLLVYVEALKKLSTEVASGCALEEAAATAIQSLPKLLAEHRLQNPQQWVTAGTRFINQLVQDLRSAT